MVFLSAFYFVVSAILYFLVSNHESRGKNRRYSRLDLLSFQDLKKVPEDWNPLKSVQTLPNCKQAKFQARPQKFRRSDNKENNHQAKLTLSSFILKELENSVQELTQKLPKHLNPNANEFLFSTPLIRNS